jgi:putative metallohydrolase (TIGR04338 family)
VSQRDQQRARVYAAESLVCRIYDRANQAHNMFVELHGSTITLPTERRFASVESMQHYADRVLALAWVQAAWPERAHVPVTVCARRGQGRAHYERITATIAIPPYERNKAWAMRELVVLHELAHHLAPDGVAPHGPEFTQDQLTLVTEIVGPEAGLLLRTAMHESGARIGVPAGLEL